MSSKSGLLLSVIIHPLPRGWRERSPFHLAGAPPARSFQRQDGLRVLAGLEMREGKQWAHVSCSYADRLPSWEDLKEVRDLFLGDVMTYQVLPPKKDWLNFHEYTLHLFHCLAGDPFPNVFTEAA